MNLNIVKKIKTRDQSGFIIEMNEGGMHWFCSYVNSPLGNFPKICNIPFTGITFAGVIEGIPCVGFDTATNPMSLEEVTDRSFDFMKEVKKMELDLMRKGINQVLND